MTQVYEITFKAKNPGDPVDRITYRIVNRNRITAIDIAQQLAGDNYRVHFVVAGPRIDADD